jgi:hypothetical protein
VDLAGEREFEPPRLLLVLEQPGKEMPVEIVLGPLRQLLDQQQAVAVVLGEQEWLVV